MTQTKEITFEAKLIRDPLSVKSDDWKETAHHWVVLINDQSFDYYTGLAHRKATGSWNKHTYEDLKNKNLSAHGLKTLCSVSKAKPPTLDDVLYSLVMDASANEQSFSSWCAELGYDDDSRKSLAIYEACQNNADKLRKAGVNIKEQAKRLEDY